jgi:hypothetical protein
LAGLEAFFRESGRFEFLLEVEPVDLSGILKMFKKINRKKFNLS